MIECHGCGTFLTGRQKKWCSSKCSKEAARRAWILKVYGLSLEEYDIILKFQGEKCFICRKPPQSGKVLHIDHEHGGHVRGLLCGYCNTRLVGRLKDHDKAQRLADYLRDPPAVKALGKEIFAPGRPKKKRQPRKKVR
jgi:hypothetical protein